MCSPCTNRSSDLMAVGFDPYSLLTWSAVQQQCSAAASAALRPVLRAAGCAEEEILWVFKT